MRRSMAFQEKLWGYIFVAPAVLGVFLWIFGPMVASIYLSMTHWDIFRPPEFIGLGNFKELLGDELVWKSLKITAYFTFGSVPLRMVAAFALAMLLNAKIRGMVFFRTAYYLPSVVPLVANAILWVWIFNVEFGLINALLQQVGIPGQRWLQSETLVVPSIILMSLWAGTGSAMIIYLAGLQGIPEEYYEAASIDGASSFRKFWHVTVPMMLPVIFFNLVMSTIGAFQVFTAGYLMTQGGPNNASLFYVLYLYRNAFQWLRLGYGAALAWFLFAIILVLTIIMFRQFERKVYYAEEG